MERKLQSENTNINFGKAGWGIVIYCLAMFFLLIGYSIDGMNIVAPAFAEKTGIEYSNVLGVSTIAGLIGVVAYILGGQLVGKIGPRYMSGICLLGAGVSYLYWGTTNTLVSYTAGLSLVTIFINIAAYLAGGSLVALWFPKKKGLVNGFTTMGHNLGSAFYVPIIAFLIAAYGISHGMAIAGTFAIVLAVVGMIFIRNIPQERGVWPDNVAEEVYKTEYYTRDEEITKSGWTVGKLLRTKELWFCAIIVGINQMVTTGVMSQLVIRNMGIGFTQEKAIALMTVCALVGVVGSYLFGFIDQKFGVKKAIISYLIWYCAALAVNVTDTPTGVYISVGMIGIAIGAAANFIVSLPSSVFGRHGFADVFGVFFPIMEIVLMMNYVINAQAIKLTGSLRGAYVLFIGILIVNIVLISLLDVRKYNKDYMVEDEILGKTQ